MSFPALLSAAAYLEGRRLFQLQSEQAERFVGAVQKIVIPGFM